MTTYRQAQDDTFTLLDDALIQAGSAVIGYIPDRHWQDLEKPELQDVSRYFVKSFFSLNIEQQDALGRSTSGERFYRSEGIFMVQFYGPKSDADVVRNLEQLALAARDTFRGVVSDNGVLYRNARINPLPSLSEWSRIDLMVDFDYEEVG